MHNADKTDEARGPHDIAADIRAWDKIDVTDLRALLDDLSACRDDDGAPIDTQGYIDMSDLPTADIPDDIDESYPIWAIDESGYVLCGDNADAVMTLDELRAEKIMDGAY